MNTTDITPEMAAQIADMQRWNIALLVLLQGGLLMGALGFVLAAVGLRKVSLLVGVLFGGLLVFIPSMVTQIAGIVVILVTASSLLVAILKSRKTEEALS